MNERNKLMIDFETLDTRPTSVAFSLGVCAFNLTGILSSGYRNISIEEGIQTGGTISESTLKFWMDMPELFKELTKSPISISETIEWLNDAVVGFDVDELWCNGAAFDFPILDRYVGISQITPKWNFRQLMDYRTLKNVFHKILRPVNKHLHHPEQDAIHQARHLIEIYNEK